jgi:hypothetical protein
MKRLMVVAWLALAVFACQRQAEPDRAARAPEAAPERAGGSEEAKAEPAGAAASASQPAAPPEAAAPATTVPPAPEPVPRPVILEAGTSLPIVLRATVSTKTAKTEDRVLAELAEDVTAGGRVVLHAGSEVRGHVVEALRPGRTKGRAHLVLSFDSVRDGGKTHAIQTSRIEVTGASTKGKDAKIAGGAAAAGAIIGGIADGGSGALKGGLIGGAAGGAAVLATRGEEIELKAGSLHKIELRSSLRFD